jgi:hypothetical protein
MSNDTNRFWPVDCRSYTYDEIHHHLFREVIQYKTEHPEATHAPAASMQGISIPDWNCPLSEIMSIVEYIRAYVRKLTILEPDVPPTTCGITLQPYRKPYLLNLNGRTYEKKAILEAIGSTLLRGMSLCLTEGDLHLQIEPWEVDRIKLYPHLTLWPAQALPPVREFELAQVQSWPVYRDVSVHDSPKLMQRLRHLDPKSAPNWQRLLTEEHFINENTGERLVHHIIIRDLVLFNHAPPYIRWANCRVVRCDLRLANFGHSQIFACRFVQCRVDLRGVDPATVQWHFFEAVWEECTFILAGAGEHGSWPTDASNCLLMDRACQLIAQRTGQFKGGTVTRE